IVSDTKPTPNSFLRFDFFFDSIRLSNTASRPPVHDGWLRNEIPPMSPTPLVERALQNDDSGVRDALTPARPPASRPPTAPARLMHRFHRGGVDHLVVSSLGNVSVGRRRPCWKRTCACSTAGTRPFGPWAGMNRARSSE